MGHDRWSYEGLLPYFRKTEHHHDPNADPQQHGFNGPIHTDRASSRTYGLTEIMKKAWVAIGVESNDDHNGGNNKGMSPHVENWHEGRRQPAGKAYGLEGVHVIVNEVVRRVILEDSGHGQTAVGAELLSGEVLRATKEIIVCCGAIRTPQLLLLSGIGPTSELSKHGIP